MSKDNDCDKVTEEYDCILDASTTDNRAISGPTSQSNQADNSRNNENNNSRDHHVCQ